MSFKIFFSHPAVTWGLEVSTGSARCNSRVVMICGFFSPGGNLSCIPSVLHPIGAQRFLDIVPAPTRNNLSQIARLCGCNATWNLVVKSIVSTIPGKQPNAMVALLGIAMFTKPLWLDMTGCYGCWIVACFFLPFCMMFTFSIWTSRASGLLSHTPITITVYLMPLSSVRKLFRGRLYRKFGIVQLLSRIWDFIVIQERLNPIRALTQYRKYSKVSWKLYSLTGWIFL